MFSLTVKLVVKFKCIFKHEFEKQKRELRSKFTTPCEAKPLGHHWLSTSSTNRHNSFMFNMLAAF